MLNKIRYDSVYLHGGSGLISYCIMQFCGLKCNASQLEAPQLAYGLSLGFSILFSDFTDKRRYLLKWLYHIMLFISRHDSVGICTAGPIYKVFDCTVDVNSWTCHTKNTSILQKKYVKDHMLSRLAIQMLLWQIGITSTTALPDAKVYLVVVDQTSSRPKMNAKKNVRSVSFTCVCNSVLYSASLWPHSNYPESYRFVWDNIRKRHAPINTALTRIWNENQPLTINENVRHLPLHFEWYETAVQGGRATGDSHRPECCRGYNKGTSVVMCRFKVVSSIFYIIKKAATQVLCGFKCKVHEPYLETRRMDGYTASLFFGLRPRSWIWLQPMKRGFAFAFCGGHHTEKKYTTAEHKVDTAP